MNLPSTNPAAAAAGWFTLRGTGAPPATPLLIDLPHGGGAWPTGAQLPSAPAAALASCRDPQLVCLWAQASLGLSPLLAARFHRACIDPNRARDDIDPDMLEDTWPGPIVPCPTSHRGMGLVRRYALPGVPLYDDRLQVADVEQRLALLYDPYHEALASMLAAAHARFTTSLHLSCVSMKPVGNALNADDGATRPDVTIGDLDGSSADPFLVRWIAATLQAQGLRVRVNDPLRGGELLRRHGRPCLARHSVQIMLNRRLYMDRHGQRSSGHAPLARLLRRFLLQLAAGLMLDVLPPRPASGHDRRSLQGPPAACGRAPKAGADALIARHCLPEG